MNTREINRKIGSLIRARRERAAITQERLAVLAGMDRTAIGKIERGERGVTVATLTRITRALRTTPSAILEGVE